MFLFLSLFYGLQKTTLVTYWKGLILPLKHHFQSPITLQHPPHCWILLLDKWVFVCISTIMTLLILFHLFVWANYISNRLTISGILCNTHLPANPRLKWRTVFFEQKVHTYHKTPWAAKCGGPKFKAKFLDFFTLSQRSLAAFSLFYLALTICLSASSRSGCLLFTNTYFQWPSIACSLE